MKSVYVRISPPIVVTCSSTRWQARQFMDCPANGPGSGWPVVWVSAMTGSPAGNWSLTVPPPSRKSLKMRAKRVSRNRRSPTASSAPAVPDGGKLAWPVLSDPSEQSVTRTARATARRDQAKRTRQSCVHGSAEKVNHVSLPCLLRATARSTRRLHGARNGVWRRTRPFRHGIQWHSFVVESVGHVQSHLPSRQ